MLKRPTSRRRSSAEGLSLNLVPIIDTMVTLIAFLLFSISIIEFVTIETTFPTTGRPAPPSKEKPLQLTVSIFQNSIEIWSPFQSKIRAKIPHLEEGQPDTQALHNELVKIKESFPTEKRVVIMPYGGTTYDLLIAIIDSIRLIEPTDPPIYGVSPKTGTSMLLTALFPDIVFGNLLGD